jgi:hypothetical protein
VPPKTVEKLLAHEEQIRLTYQVAQLRTGVKLKRRQREGDLEGLTEFLREFECESLISNAGFLVR